MRLDTAFRLSFYTTLALACTCLAQAEAFFLPWFPYICLPLAGVIFVLAWRHEGRWVIHETVSNYLGICIFLATGGWILFQLPRSQAELVAGGVPWPAGLLPHLGPLLLVLLAVKLFRPKILADFWTIQTMGLMIVTLGCVLAGDALFAGLLLLYLASLVWCLALFQLYRAQRPQGAVPLFAHPDAAPMHAVVPWPRLGITRALRWALAVAAAGMPIFMLLPRIGNAQWVPQKLASAAGSAATVGVEPGINLNRVGTVELSAEPAFSVTVRDDHRKPASLRHDQLWRVEVLDYYFPPHWMTWAQAREFSRAALPPAPPALVPAMPAQGTEHQRLLRFRVRPSQAGGLVLAEPVDIRHIGLESIAGEAPPIMDLFQPIPGADTAKGFAPQRRLLYRYTQVLSGADVMERIPARFYDDAYGTYLAEQTVPEAVVAWAQQRLGDLPRLDPMQRRLDGHGRLAREHHAAVSAAFCHYFAHSGEYRYSLTLKRHARLLDPTADFLLNVKSGHCERFAAALALSLRALGVPARIVKGYRGADAEEPGRYVVRLDQAHSWVQVLIQDGDDWVWLTLDPTPGDDDTSNPLANWFGWLRDADPELVWRRYVLNYNGDAQANAIHYLLQFVTGRHLLWQIPTLGAVAMLALVAWRRRGRLRFVWRRADRAPVAPGFYTRLLRVLARHCNLRPEVGHTPLEFAECAGAALASNPATALWAALPVQAAHALYRERYAGRGLEPAQSAALMEAIAALEQAAKRQ